MNHNHNPSPNAPSTSRVFYFNFAENGDEDEQAFEKGDDPYAAQIGMRTNRSSYERIMFLLKKFITAFPVLPTEQCPEFGFRGSLEHAGKECNAASCRQHLIRVGTTYMCPFSGNIHECPADGCKLGVKNWNRTCKHCPLTGNDSYITYRNSNESMSAAAMKRLYQNGEEEDGDDSDGSGEEEDQGGCEIFEDKSSDHDHCTVPWRGNNSFGRSGEESQPKARRISKEGRQSTEQNICELQGIAEGVATGIFKDFVPRSVRNEWIEKHVLYLWKLVTQTRCYQRYSMRYKMKSHTKVVFDEMVDGFKVDEYDIIPKMETVSQLVLKQTPIKPPLKAVKFFKACLQETLDVSDPVKRTELLKIISLRL